MGSTFSLSLSQFCIWKRLFPPFGGTLWKIKTMRCPDPTVLQRWYICKYAHHGLEGGGGGAISDIFWSTWHIVLWSPEDWGSGKVLLCSVSGSNWLYQKHRIIVGISKQSFSWGHLTQRHSFWHHTQIPVLSLTQPVPLWFGHFFYFYPLNFPSVFLRVCGYLDRRCLLPGLTSEKSHCIISVPSLSPPPRRSSFPGSQGGCLLE